MLRNTTTLKENEKETKSESRLILQISNIVFFFFERERESVCEAKEDFSFFMFEDVIRLMGV